MNHAKTILSYQKCCLVSKLYLTLCDPMDCRLPVFSVLMGFSKQEYWSGLPFPSPGDLVSSPNPGIELESHASPALTGRFFIWETPYKKQMEINIKKKEKHRFYFKNVPKIKTHFQAVMTFPVQATYLQGMIM